VLLGLGGSVAAAIAMVVLCITLVGIPVAVALGIVMALGVWAGHVGVSLALGVAALKRFSKVTPALIGASVVGLTILVLAEQLPGVGSIIGGAVWLAGIGGVLLSGFGTDRDWLADRIHRASLRPGGDF
jgi:hypothetical protein